MMKNRKVLAVCFPEPPSYGVLQLDSEIVPYRDPDLSVSIETPPDPPGVIDIESWKQESE